MKSIYHLIPFLAVLLSIPVSLPAQKHHTDANIYGHVIDASTREHLGFASVVVKDMGIGAETDSTGHYLIANLSEGRHTIEVSFIGYRSVTLTITAEPGRSEEHNFELVPESDYLEQVVVTGSRYATKRRESGQIVNVVSPKLFEKTVAVNPAGVLDFQPGLRVEYDCSNCGFSQLRINGLSGQYTQVLLDSRPVFSSLSMVYGLEQFPASMIERIEVVRGGGSALFGSSAIGGTVNIITREPTSSSLDFSNHCGIIGGETFENNTALNASLLSDDRSTGAYLFTMVRSREGYDHDGDGFTNLPKLLSETIGMRAYHKFSSRAKITAEYHHIHEYRRGGDSLQWQPHLCMIAEQLEHRIDGGGLSFDYSSERDAFSLYASAQNIGRNSYYGTGRNPDAYGITSDITFNAGLQYIRRISRFLFMPSTFTAGADYTANLLNDRIPGYNRFLNQHTRVGGVYIQNEWSGSHFGWLVGLRADKHNLLSEPVFSPRMILRYAPDSHWTLRAGYAAGFRAPQAYDEDLHVAAVGGEVSLIRLDQNLKPEHSDAFTVSADYWMQAGGWKFNMLLEGFHTGLRDVFVLEPDGHDEQGNLLLKRTNSAGASVTGTNLEIRALNGRDLEIQSGVTLQRSRYAEPYRWSENVEPQERMHRSPDWYGYLTLDWEMTHSLEASLNGTLTGPMLVEHYAGAIAEDTLVTTDPFADLSARISWHFHPTAYLRCALSLSCKNLLNSFQKDMDFGPLKDSGYVYGPAQPRSWMLGVKLTF